MRQFLFILLSFIKGEILIFLIALLLIRAMEVVYEEGSFIKFLSDGYKEIRYKDHYDYNGRIWRVMG